MRKQQKKVLTMCTVRYAGICFVCLFFLFVFVLARNNTGHTAVIKTGLTEISLAHP